MASRNSAVWIPIPMNISIVHYFERYITVVEKRPSCWYGTLSLYRLNSLTGICYHVAFGKLLIEVPNPSNVLRRPSTLFTSISLKRSKIWTSLIYSGWKIMKCETKIPPVRERETVEERKDRTKICINRHFYYFHVYLFKIKAIFISLVILLSIPATILKSKLFARIGPADIQIQYTSCFCVWIP